MSFKAEQGFELKSNLSLLLATTHAGCLWLLLHEHEQERQHLSLDPLLLVGMSEFQTSQSTTSGRKDTPE